MMPPTSAADVRRLDEASVSAHQADLCALLIDAVDSGASVGFLPPLSAADAQGYWEGVRRALHGGGRWLFGAFSGGRLVGSVQLDLAGMANGSHRAEVMKLFVHRSARRQGVARALMLAIESQARAAGRTLLVLDTRHGDEAERLYRALGYVQAGVIPRYARSASGELAPTIIMYRWLG